MARLPTTTWAQNPIVLSLLLASGGAFPSLWGRVSLMWAYLCLRGSPHGQCRAGDPMPPRLHHAPSFFVSAFLCESG